LVVVALAQSTKKKEMLGLKQKVSYWLIFRLFSLVAFGDISIEVVFLIFLFSDVLG